MSDQNADLQTTIHPASLLRAVIESAPSAMVMINMPGKIVLVNAETEKLFGYARADLLGQPVEMLVPQRFRSLHPAYRTSFFADPRVRRMGAGRDLFGRRADGTEFPIEIGLNPIQTDEELFVLSAIVDISERKRLEARFRATVESAPTAMVMIDRQGFVSLVNAETEKLFGYGRDELLGRPVEVLVPERFRAEHPQWREAFFGSPAARRMGVNRDLSGVRKDGSEFPVEIGLNPLETDEGTFVLASVIDITERKRSEDQFRLAVEAAPNGMVMVDQDGRIVLLNALMELLFGYSREELLGQAVEILVPERFRANHPQRREGFFVAPQTRSMGAGLDLYGRRKDGSEFPVEIGLNPLETDGGRFALASVIDITERRRAEEMQRQLNEELERSNVELRQFAYVASHDLQAPLRGIAGFAQFLQADYQGQFDEKADDYLDRIVRGVKRMQQLISDLLTYSRVDSRSVPFQPIKLGDVFDDAVALLQSSIEEVGGKVTRDELPTVDGDRSQLCQLLQNLISNGLKYYGETPPLVHVSAERKGGEWTVAVRDNGIGIDAKQHERIFEIFRRLHSADKYPGTGIGLAVCKRVAHRHGGKIWLESEIGQGSTFYFTLPERGNSEQEP